MDYTVHGILQARIAFPFSRASSQPGDWTQLSHCRQLLYQLSHKGSPPRSKCLLISWLQSPSTVILEPRKIKSITVSIVSPSICHEVMRPDAMILVFESWALSQVLLNHHHNWKVSWCPLAIHASFVVHRQPLTCFLSL